MFYYNKNIISVKMSVNMSHLYKYVQNLQMCFV
jgi:hypothetical protein